MNRPGIRNGGENFFKRLTGNSFLGGLLNFFERMVLLK